MPTEKKMTCSLTWTDHFTIFIMITGSFSFLIISVTCIQTTYESFKCVQSGLMKVIQKWRRKSKFGVVWIHKTVVNNITSYQTPYNRLQKIWWLQYWWYSCNFKKKYYRFFSLRHLLKQTEADRQDFYFIIICLRIACNFQVVFFQVV